VISETDIFWPIQWEQIDKAPNHFYLVKAIYSVIAIYLWIKLDNDWLKVWLTQLLS
jgi:hypothetical protein